MSEPPCGDASIFELIDQKLASTTIKQMHFTGAKLIVSQHNQDKVEVLREPNEQTLGALRLKSGRSDIE